MVQLYNNNSLLFFKGLRFSLSLFFLLASLTNLYSQNLSRIYVGAIVTKEKSIIMYELHIKYNELNGGISGYSITDKNKKNETTCLVSGKYDKKTNTLTFSEYKVQETKVKSKPSEMCFVHFNGKLFHKNENVIKGKYIGKYQNGNNCSTGSIFLASRDMVLSTLDTVAKSKDTNLREISKEASIINVAKGNTEKVIYVNADTVSIFISDDYKLDNDIVNLYLNNVLVKENIVLAKYPYRYKVATNSPIQIKLKAINVGYISPNTSSISVKSKYDNIVYLNELKTEETVEFKIIKKK